MKTKKKLWGHSGCAEERAMLAFQKNQHAPVNSGGFTLIELLLAVVMAAIIIAGVNSVMNAALESSAFVEERTQLTREAQFAMERIVRNVSQSRLLLLPLADNSTTNWPENIREETVPPSPPIGDSTLATAVLAVTLPAVNDLDFDGFPDADNDRDGRIDEDIPGDQTYDFAAGIYLIDDDGDGDVDEGLFAWSDDDEVDGVWDEDPIDGDDNDGDGRLDEDPSGDSNGDGCQGICGVDDDGDATVDEGFGWFDDDEDGANDEDWFDPVVFYLNGGSLIERVAVPWDENGGGFISGQDFVESTIAENVTHLRVERVSPAAGQTQLVDITLDLTGPGGETVSLNTRARVGGAL